MLLTKLETVVLGILSGQEVVEEAVEVLHHTPEDVDLNHAAKKTHNRE